ncbi:MAG: hypothetical protein KA586_04060 [Candidatus Promineofilum sp.]|nr:hypothetical protein [Promineifilum sp.]
MEERERQFIPGLGTLLLAILFLGGIGVLLHDFKGLQHGPWGALAWGGAVFFSFILGTAYISRRLLPLPYNPGWAEGFRLLLQNYVKGAANALYGRRADPALRSVKKSKLKSDELSPSFAWLGAGFLYSHQAAAITRGNGYSRADGPGLVILRGGETVAQVFDLRPQSRKMKVSALTRDGIPVETSVSVTFKVRGPATDRRRPRSVETDPIPYPYDKDALFDLNYTASVVDDDRRDWTEQVCPQAATLLITEIGKYPLADLLVSAASEPLAEIKNNIKAGLKEQQTNSEFQIISRGIDILGVGVGPLELSADVIAKRVATWQVEWRNRTAQEAISGDIEAKRVYQKALAEAQVENIEKLLTSIEAMRSQGIELHEIVMGRIMQILEAIAAARTLTPLSSRAATASLAADATSHLRRVLEQNEE